METPVDWLPERSPTLRPSNPTHHANSQSGSSTPTATYSLNDDDFPPLLGVLDFLVLLDAHLELATRGLRKKSDRWKRVLRSSSATLQLADQGRTTDRRQTRCWRNHASKPVKSASNYVLKRSATNLRNVCHPFWTSGRTRRLSGSEINWLSFSES